MKGSVFFTLRGRNHLLKTLHNVRVTLLCGLLTFIVLRSSLGAGKFGTPVQDYDEIRHHLHSFKLRHQHKLLLSRELTVETSPHKDASRSTLSLPAAERHGDGALNPVDNARHRPHILLVTGSHSCEGAIEAQFLLRSLHNKMDYCNFHGIEIFYDVETAGTSARSNLLQEIMLTHPQVEWIWWMDSLAMFTDMSAHLTFERYAGYNVIVHGREGSLSSEDAMVNMWDKLWGEGSFLLRNCEWSHNYLANAGWMQVSQVFVDTKMEMYEPGVGESETWTFITHFGSCSLCGKGNIDHLSCLTQMERAFNHADSQRKHVGSH